MEDDDLFEYGPSAAVMSPCILVCTLDLVTGWCLGCGRSEGEIAEWSAVDDARRQAILDTLPARMTELRAR
ncbi:DUF1289 domain-containing protein [Sphingomonas sp.]|uniref:DUF1289 domain-containing protein n=1 Tax=Sphingomonas sp. TaxID=28214 RepID=UPI002C9AADF6|nr:DUF1289 domain-containing protein [Sphingomonas sp.]HWK35710.1 DUF1289 domain-containing protein [Sphingomonas sp.]